jgi:hypothetical protein
MAELPSGTVTVLLTDVEGSTALWEEAPEAMRAALALHDALFVFLDRPDVPPTDNASEQDLRTSVIHRSVTDGHRSRRGAEVSAILTSLLTSARKRAQNCLSGLRAIAGPPPLRVAGLPD